MTITLLTALIHAAICLALAFTMFCRLRITTYKTHHHVRWALAAVFTASLASAVAAYAWPKHWHLAQTLLVFSFVYLQWAMSRQWTQNAPPQGLI